ncbi:MAG: hypothetical protein ACXAB7_01070 [Candidatus Kariarchaeaceae archaeon]|jgi:hypothetical protein
MHKDFIFKLQLVSKSGIMLAEIPKSTDATASQLSGGIMSAIMAFSKEVHKRDIEAISYHDRSVIFVPIENLILVAEVSLSISPELLTFMIQIIKEKAEFILHDINNDNINPDEAELKLQHIYDSQWFHSLLEDIGMEKTLSDANLSDFNVNTDNFNIISFNGNHPEIELINTMLVNHKKYLSDRTLYCGFILLRDVNRGAFVFASKSENKIRVGILSVVEDKISNLFKLSPVLTTLSRKYYEERPNGPAHILLEQLSQVHDVSEHQSPEVTRSNNIEEVNKILKDFDKVIFSTVVGDPVVLVGDRDKIHQIVEVLRMFSSHQLIEVIPWLEGKSIGKHITGMSKEKYEEIKDTLDDTIIIGNTETKKIQTSRIRSNKYIRKLCDRTKMLTYKQAGDIINGELQLITNYTINASSSVINKKENLLSALEDLKSSIGDSAQYEIIQSMLVRINSWLNLVIHDQSYDDQWI